MYRTYETGVWTDFGPSFMTRLAVSLEEKIDFILVKHSVGGHGFISLHFFLTGKVMSSTGVVVQPSFDDATLVNNQVLWELEINDNGYNFWPH